MQYRNMGKWGLKLSEISIGSWMTDLNGLGAAETARQSIRAACRTPILYRENLVTDGLYRIWLRNRKG